jgi:hypothetical protein
MIPFSLVVAVLVMKAVGLTAAVSSVSLTGQKIENGHFRQNHDQRFLDEDPSDSATESPDSNNLNSASYPLGTDVWWQFDGKWCVMTRICYDRLKWQLQQGIFAPSLCATNYS